MFDLTNVVVYTNFRFAKWSCDRLKEDDGYDKKVSFSDEAHFDLGGFVNKQNCRIWGTEKLMHPRRVAVWCGFWSRSISGPLFFINVKGKAVTANGDLYRAMLNESLFTKIGTIRFQQDGATCHIIEAKLDAWRPVSELWFDTVGLLFVMWRQR